MPPRPSSADPERTGSPRRAPGSARDAVLVALAGVPDSERLIRRAANLAQRAGADLVGVHVRTGSAAPGRSVVATEHRRLLAALDGDYIEVEGDDVPAALTRVAGELGATQLVLGATGRARWRDLGGRSVLQRLARDAAFDVHVITAPDTSARAGRLLGLTVPVGPRRRSVAWLLVGLGAPALIAALVPFRSEHTLPAALLLFVVLTVAVASVGGTLPAITLAFVAFLGVNFFLTPPFHTFVVGTAANLLALITFLLVGSVISFLVGQVTRRSEEATKAQAEAEALAHAAGGLVGVRDPLTALADRLCAAFDLDGVAVLAPADGGWTITASAGAVVPASPAESTGTIPLGDGDHLALIGPELTDDDRRVVRAFAAQLTAALEQRRLQAEAARVAALAEVDRLRTALLRAASHDLRTPLASIKASVSSLLQDDVDWPPEAINEFLSTIEEESDRLDHVIGNLLDMGRLQAGALQAVPRPVSLEEVVPAALTSLSADTSRVELAIDEHSPPVEADPALLERAVANVVSNALAWTSAPGPVAGLATGGAPVRVEARRVGDGVELRVVDRGPGVTAADRDRVFEPFQRLGDRSNDTGAGLGLAVARGFVEAMNGRIHIEDTPGGGLTMVIVLPGADGRERGGSGALPSHTSDGPGTGA